VKRHTTFRFTLTPTAEQAAALRRHTGAARFGYNQCLRLVLDGLEAKKEAPETRVPWSGFDLINAFNQWKRSADAGVDEAGKAGLRWRGEVCQQVFEEGAVNLGRALEAFTASRKGERRGKRSLFPKFKHKTEAFQSFRLRNKKDEIRVAESGTRTLRLPKLGVVAVRECTRKLRRMLGKGRAKILFATVSERGLGRWAVSLNVEAAPLHEHRRHPEADALPVVGIDRGLNTFAVVADAGGRELDRIDSPRPLRAALSKLRRRSRSLSRKQKGSRNRRRARRRLSQLHRRIGNVRRDFVHRQSSRLAKTHRSLVIENLCTMGLMRTRLARSIADSAWAMFATMLAYKAAWYGGTLTLADRFYPSTRRCSACGQLGPSLGLSERTFRCSGCGHEADRDTNAAVCLGQFPGLDWPPVAAKQAETLNVCGEKSAGAQAPLGRETRLYETERASAQRPRRAVWTVRETVHTL
jgi:putative transposase